MLCVIGEAAFKKRLRTAEPIATLKRYRPGGLRNGFSGLLPITMGGSRGLAPLFGVFMGTETAEATGEIKVGDQITVLSYHQ